MAQLVVRKPKETFLHLANPDAGLYPLNHIYEPEYHQTLYVSVCERLSKLSTAFQLGSCKELVGEIHRGLQPQYVDDEEDPSTLRFEGMILEDGTILEAKAGEILNVCALKSVSVRFGYLDFGVARSVTRDFYEKRKNKAGVKKGDILINSTGDGTIGRVAVYNRDLPAVVDGHITVVRLSSSDLAWYVAAFLLSSDGQKQIYRYINGSSGQVEVYPQDIARLWVNEASATMVKSVAVAFRAACEKHDSFTKDLKTALSMLGGSG